MMAVACETGEIIWETQNPNDPDDWKMTHASIVPMEFNGRRTYVYCASGGVVGVRAEDGKILWQTNEWMIRTATVPSPVIVDQRRIFFCGGYNAGSMMLQLKEQADGIQPEVLFRLDAP